MGETIARILLAAPASGSGKTTLTCALLEALRRRGKHPVSFKCGPDYIDPMFHRSVQQVPSWNLDSYFTPPDMLCSLFQDHARRGNIAVLEGVMGYYDGIRGTDGRASTYEIASLTDTPVILVVNRQKEDETVVQQIRRILDFREDHHIAGVLLNCTDPDRGGDLEEIRRNCPVPVLGAIPYRPELTIPSAGSDPVPAGTDRSVPSSRAASAPGGCGDVRKDRNDGRSSGAVCGCECVSGYCRERNGMEPRGRTGDPHAGEKNPRPSGHRQG